VRIPTYRLDPTTSRQSHVTVLTDPSHSTRYLANNVGITTPTNKHSRAIEFKSARPPNDARPRSRATCSLPYTIKLRHPIPFKYSAHEPVSILRALDELANHTTSNVIKDGENTCGFKNNNMHNIHTLRFKACSRGLQP
jgi:hypothetical protein